MLACYGYSTKQTLPNVFKLILSYNFAWLASYRMLIRFQGFSSVNISSLVLKNSVVKWTQTYKQTNLP